MPVTESELAHLREEVELWMTDRIDAYRNTVSEDEYGGRGEESTPTKIYSNVPCTIQSGIRHFQTLNAEGLERFRQEMIIYTKWDVRLRVNDHVILIEQDGVAVELELRVQAVLAPETMNIDNLYVCNRLGEEVGEAGSSF